MKGYRKGYTAKMIRPSGKILPALLTAALLLTACSVQQEALPSENTADTEAKGSVTASGNADSSVKQEDLPEEERILLKYPLISSSTDADLTQVQLLFNEYLEEKLPGTEIQFVNADFENLEDFYLLQKAGREQTDFISMLPVSEMLSDMVREEMLLPMEELLESDGQGILESAGSLLEVGRLNGHQYMIPQLKDAYTMGTGLEFNAALVRKYDFDITKIRTIEDLEPMLEVIREKEPDVIPLTSYQSIGFTTLLGGFDSLGDTLGVLDLSESNELTVVDWYETDRFAELAGLMHDWYRKGYIDKDAVVAQTAGNMLVHSGGAFCTISTYMPTQDQGTDPDNPTGIVEVQLSDQPQLLNSYYAGLEGVGISSSCQYPEEAMQFLNLLFTDAYLTNLLEYGVEGENYTLTEEGLADTGGNYFLLYGQPLDQRLRYISTENGKEYTDKCRAYLEKDVESPALGFVYDDSSVTEETALCRAAVDQYFRVIDCGCVDPETEIPKFVSALKEAGIDRILEEKQRQLDLWKNEQ